MKLIKERIISATDFHIGSGGIKIRVPHFGKQAILEYFIHDQIFFDTVKTILADSKGIPLTLQFLGDTFDFFSIKNKKSEIETDPTLDGALYKINKALDAHPIFIKTLQAVVLAGGKIRFIIGNHDMQLYWSNIQWIIRKRVFSKELIKSVSQETSDYFRLNMENIIIFTDEFLIGNVLFIHGNNADVINATPNPEKRFIHQNPKGKNLSIPLLHLPLGAYIAELSIKMAVGNWFAPPNYLIGRMERHEYVYLESFARRWRFGLYAATLWLAAPWQYRFSNRWWINKEASLKTLFKKLVEAMMHTMQNNNYLEYGKKLLKERGLKTVVMGHIHDYGNISDENGRVIFAGPWIETYKVNFEDPKLQWPLLRWLEKIIKYKKLSKKLFNPKNADRYKPKPNNLHTIVVCDINKEDECDISILSFDPETKIFKKLS